MDALEALHGRISYSRAVGEPPTNEDLQAMFQAALRAPDHGLMRPWRFLTIVGQARVKLGELFLSAQVSDGESLTEIQRQRTLAKPLRAPLVIVVIARVRPHPKVPEVEQLMSAAAAAQNILLAAHAMGYAAMWRTGAMAYHSVVNAGLGLAAAEQIVGYLYIGETQGRSRKVPRHDVNDYVTDWQGESQAPGAPGT